MTSATGSASGGGSELFFFVHIRKTAGTTLRQRLINHLGERAVYPTLGVDGTDRVLLMLSIDHLRRRLTARRDEIKIVTAHMPACVAEELDVPVTTLTLLRDPVERMLSSLRDDRETNPACAEMSLEEIYERGGGFAELARNHMVRMLAISPEELTATEAALATGSEAGLPGFGREHLDRAKERLGAIDTFGFQEHFDDFCRELDERFGWQLGGAERVNTTTYIDVPDAFRARIAEDNGLDIELYAFARALTAERGR